jgi:hypothetical protein
MQLGDVMARGPLMALAPTLLAVVVNLGCSAETAAPEPVAVACHLIGCYDAFTATIVAPEGFPAGTHEVEIMADGWETTCTFQLPLPRFKGGDPETPSCSPSLMLWFDSATGDEVMTIAGTPRGLRVRQLANRVVILDQTSTPTYSIEQPNGPLCSPSCYFAGVTWSLASSDGGLDSRAGD